MPEVSPELVGRIKDLVRAIDGAPPAMVSSAVADVLRMLEGIPATDSLEILVYLATRHEQAMLGYLADCRAGNARMRYMNRLKMLGELFAPARMARITETVRYIEIGWGL